MAERTCSTEGCDLPCKARGMCRTHYNRWLSKRAYEADPEKHRQRNRAYREANRERRNAEAKAWRQANPERKREYERANRDRINAQRRARRNPEREAERQRRWNVANRDRKAALQTVRRGRKVNAPGTATPDQIAARWAYYGDKCWMCREAPATATDHVKPLAKGGSNWPANLRPACATCNSKKGSAWPFAA